MAYIPPDESSLDAAVHATRHVADGEQPPAAVLQRVRKAVHTAVGQEVHPGESATGRVGHLLRSIPHWMKAAVAAVLIIGFGGTLSYLLVGSDRTEALAGVRSRLRESETMSFTARVHQPGRPPVTFRAMFREPGWMRQESTDGVVSVLDFSSRQGLTLLPGHGRALRVWLGRLPDATDAVDGRFNYIAELRDLLDRGDVEMLTARRVQGRPACGFRLRHQGRSMDVWLDAGTGDPLRFEMDAPTGPGRIVLTDICLGPDLPSELFSLRPPDGYELEPGPPVDLAAANEHDLVTSLGLLAKFRGGVFPPQPTLWTPDLGRLVTTDMSYGQLTTLALSLTRTSVFLSSLPGEGSEWCYGGAGVRLGEPDTPVLWWRPRGAKRYRAIFADLTVRDVEPARLPDDCPCPNRHLATEMP